MTKTAAAVASLLAGLTLAGCGATVPKAVPDVTGQRLDMAQDTLDATGLRYSTVGGGAFGIVVRSHWVVCRQTPRARARATSVTLYVGRVCPSSRASIVPDVVDQTLEDARSTLEDAGFGVTAESLDGDPILAESLWTVCDQKPEPGHRGRSVVLEVAQDCWDYS